MNEKLSNHHMNSLKLPPREQFQYLFRWFSQHEVTHFDIHVRRYIQEKEHWITIHEDISGDAIDKLWPWLRRENARGADIYFRPASKKDHPVIFLDDITSRKAKEISLKISCAVVETSRGNTHMWIIVDRRLSLEERKYAQSQLSKLGYGDPSSISGDHLGRICGFKSQKNKCWVNAKQFSTTHTYSPPKRSDNNQHMREGGACALKNTNNNSQSERDFGWALGMLRIGKSVDYVQTKLTESSICRNKRNPEKYARLTALKAANFVGLIALG
jgi:hypothetical protein